MALILVAVVLFVTEALSVELVALIVMATLLISGTISTEEGIAGFSNMATVTVGAMFVLSAGLVRTGVVNLIGDWLTAASRGRTWLALLIVMLTSGVLSAFINNTAAVAIFLPITIGLARTLHMSPTKLLMPLSFASMFGGVCTLLGTSTNILVSSIAEQHGLPPFSMFEFLPFGILLFLVGTVYMYFIGVHLVPNRRMEGDLTAEYGMGDYLTEIVLLEDGDSVGKTLEQAPLVKDLDLDILHVRRRGASQPFPSKTTLLEAGDLLVVRCSIEKVKKLQERVGVALKSQLKLTDRDLISDRSTLVEAILSPNSPLVGRSLKEANFRQTFQAMTVALRHSGQILRENLANTPLSAGDALLISVDRAHLPSLRKNKAFVFVSEVPTIQYRKRKMFPALLIVAFVVTTAATGFFPIVTSAIVGCVLMVVTRCITMGEVYESIEWPVIFLLAGVLTMGVALENTGGAQWIADGAISLVGQWGPVAVLSAMFIFTVLMTAFTSNNATAALLAPIAIATAASMDVDSRPFLMAVTFGASLSFMTPVGYQTNLMIYGAGQYKFADFIKVGTPLNIIFWIMATWLIPVFWPF